MLHLNVINGTAKQMHLFSKGLASITAMEPVMRQLALEKTIDRILSEGDMDNNISLHDVHGEGDASKNGAETESLTSSPTTLLVNLRFNLSLHSSKSVASGKIYN